MLPKAITRRPAHRQAGFTLIEVLIAAGIAVAAVSVALSLIQITQKSYTNAATISNRDRLARNIERVIQDMDRIRYAAANDGSAGNRALSDCLTAKDLTANPSLAPTCSATLTPFRFVLKQGSPNPIAGDSQSPVYYGRDGAPCTAGTSCQFFKVITYFTPSCTSVSSDPTKTTQIDTCYQARSIRVTYQITALKPLIGGQTLGPKPTDLTASGVNFAISFGLPPNSGCPIFAVMTGYGPGGTIVCRCVTGSTPTGTNADGTPICSQPVGVSCPGNAHLLGIAPDNSPICSSGTIICTPTTNNTCSGGDWLGTLDLGDCNPVYISDNDPVPIDCSGQTGKCCHEQ